MKRAQVKQTDAGKVVGKFRFTTIDSVTGEVLKVSDWHQNLIVSNLTSGGNGVNILIKGLLGIISTVEVTSASIGTGTTAAANADTDLETAVLEDIPVTGSSEVAANELLLEFYITSSELPDDDYSEFALKCGTRLLARAIISPAYTKGTNQDTKVEYSITINN